MFNPGHLQIIPPHQSHQNLHQLHLHQSKQCYHLEIHCPHRGHSRPQTRLQSRPLPTQTHPFLRILLQNPP